MQRDIQPFSNSDVNAVACFNSHIFLAPPCIFQTCWHFCRSALFVLICMLMQRKHYFSQMFCNIYCPLFTSSPPPLSIHIAQKFSSSHYFFCQVIFHLSACLPRAKFCFFCGSGIVGFCVNPKDPLPVAIKKAVG